MCKYCETFTYNGEESIMPLPSNDGDGAEFAICPDDDGNGYIIMTAEYPPSIARGIKYCPMCGREL